MASRLHISLVLIIIFMIDYDSISNRSIGLVCIRLDLYYIMNQVILLKLMKQYIINKIIPISPL